MPILQGARRRYRPAAPAGTLDRGAADADHRSIAERLRAERHGRGLTLRELASRVSISTARLSAIEQSKQTLRVDLLLALAGALDVPLEHLLPPQRAAQCCIVRRLEADSRQYQPMKLVSRASGAAIGYHNRLRPLADAFVGKRMQPLEIEIHPVPDDRLQFIAHHHEEFVFVLQGEVECLLKTPDGIRRERLADGDCMYFWSYLPHCIRAIGSESARGLHLLFSRDEPADSELSGADAGTIYLLDAVHKTLADRIAAQMVALRRTRAMSIGQFARLLGTSPRRLSEIERGQKSVSVQFLLNVCHRCGKPLEHFLGGSVAPRPYCEVHRAGADRGGTAYQDAAAPPCVEAVVAVPLITAMPERGMSPFLVKVSDGVQPPRLGRHSGQEFLFVLKGSIQLTTVEGDRLHVDTLAPGDACFLDANAPHAFAQVRLRSYDGAPAEAIVVILNS